MSAVLFEDIFDIKDIDPDGKKFDRGECRLRFRNRLRIRNSFGSKSRLGIKSRFK